MADYLVLQLEKRLQPIIDRVGPELHHTASPGPVVYELRHRGVETTPEGKELGPTKGGFVLVAGTVEDLASFKSPQYPFNWEGYPKQTNYSWSSEYHLLPVKNGTWHGRWLFVGVWCGPDADQELIRELLAAASKLAEEQLVSSR